MKPIERISEQLIVQGRACAFMGSPMYGELLARAARDLTDGGFTRNVLLDHDAPGRGRALALRFMAAVHRLVLSGEAPELAAWYPSVTGVPYDAKNIETIWTAFHRLLATRTESLQQLVSLPCQTNEVGRCAALIGGFLEVAARWQLPLRILEVGASAGLNLRCDHFRYTGDGKCYGPEKSPVQLVDYWKAAPPHTDSTLHIVERSGCDLRPIDPASSAGRLGLRASLWADQLHRFQHLQGALTLAQQVPVQVERESLETWTRGKLKQPTPGVATVVFHSIVYEYLPDAVRSEFHQVPTEAGARATEDAPVSYLRLESISELRHHGIEITHWPGGLSQVRGKSSAHGQNVEWR